jgi:hypothetical protein
MRQLHVVNQKPCGRNQSWPPPRNYLSICLEGLRRATKQHHNNGFFSQDSNQRPLKYKSDISTSPYNVPVFTNVAGDYVMVMHCISITP